MNISQTIRILSIIDAVQFVFASFLNVLLIFICFRSTKLNKVPVFIFMSFFSISNLVYLFGVSLVWFINFIFGLNLEIQSWTWCKINLFIQMFTYHWLSFIVASFSLSFYLSTRFAHLYNRYLSLSKMIIYAIVLGLMAFSLNFPVLFTDDLRHSNSSGQIDPTLLCLAPFAFNSYLSKVLIVIDFLICLNKVLIPFNLYFYFILKGKFEYFHGTYILVYYSIEYLTFSRAFTQ